MAGVNPFEQGRAAALAGVAWSKCPYRITQKEFTRWNCGFQSALDERRRAKAAQAQAGKAAEGEPCRAGR